MPGGLPSPFSGSRSSSSWTTSIRSSGSACAIVNVAQASWSSRFSRRCRWFARARARRATRKATPCSQGPIDWQLQSTPLSGPEPETSPGMRRRPRSRRPNAPADAHHDRTVGRSTSTRNASLGAPAIVAGPEPLQELTIIQIAGVADVQEGLDRSRGCPGATVNHDRIPSASGPDRTDYLLVRGAGDPHSLSEKRESLPEPSPSDESRCQSRGLPLGSYPGIGDKSHSHRRKGSPCVIATSTLGSRHRASFSLSSGRARGLCLAQGEKSDKPATKTVAKNLDLRPEGRRQGPGCRGHRAGRGRTNACSPCSAATGAAGAISCTTCPPRTMRFAACSRTNMSS